ncbi:fungal-specific transcription factor domain-containing protein [Lipomyces orientalis]|uniref:Fungal-specific transcription factor domain-containing protein n=1 Tax=Lipomyces orientalis TaxID=1233043 RepID=A0ACC3TGK7_9ASCO
MTLETAPRRRCWTCRDRKVRCDLTLPFCRTCARTGRKCQGYGLRLSWPAATDKRRSIVGSHLAKPTTLRRSVGPHHFINTSVWDVKFHDCVSNWDPSAGLWLLEWHQPAIPTSPKITGAATRGISQDLVTYFTHEVAVAHASTTISASWFSSVVLKLALIDDSPSSAAVLNSMLALSSLYYRGHDRNALQYKTKALSALRASLKIPFGMREAQQHIAAGMLLCSFEIFVHSDTSFQWPLYLYGAKRMLDTYYHGRAGDSDLDMLIVWTHYHDILGRLTARHWRDDEQKTRPNPYCGQSDHAPALALQDQVSTSPQQVLGITGCSLELLDLIAQIAQLTTSTHGIILDQIESKLIALRQENTIPGQIDQSKDTRNILKIAELYRLSALVYLERILRKRLTVSEQLQGWINDAFTILSQLEVCPRQFPLLILGCEAMTEDQRLEITRIFRNTSALPTQRSIDCNRHTVERFWVQRDLLTTEDPIDYSLLFDAVMRTGDVLPTIV